MDERNKQTAYKIMSVMYLLTIIAIQVIVIYRQLVLKQSIEDFEDIAIIMVVNTIFLLSALLYFGAIPVQKIKIKSILLFYALIIVFGSLFTYTKYTILSDNPLSTNLILNKILIVGAVSGLFVLFMIVFALLGKRKLDKEIESE